MAKLIYMMNTSLDGYVAERDGTFDWAVPTAELYATYNDFGGHAMEEVHEALANGLLALVLVHIAGVVASSLLHGENLVRAMITGYKSGVAGAGIRYRHRIVGAMLVGSVAAFWMAR